MITLAHAAAQSTSTPSQFFARWIDHDSWSEWAPDIQWVRLTGPVAEGTRGVLKPKGGPAAKFVISALVTDREYTDTSKLPGATLVFQHLVSPSPTGADLEVRVTLDGPLARLWAAILGKGFASTAPADLERLVDVVQRNSLASQHAQH